MKIFENRVFDHVTEVPNIQIGLGTTFQFKLTILIFLDQICPKAAIPVKNGKSEHHHWILHIPIGLGTYHISA